ncbi:hypothetical protein QNH20_18505 [Neobacillus sp. WH10]|uniref:hypothetical protein n=1 Tax=Neobacillus sp. WH10 TaxID=3047873 RepID=UPI0024C1298D|nr:hypothetical protein [Neobacillus sp. WH10]WHY76104.1 hypothetical protein QNH20_18505 [Neobacillus sp. WH10]
MNLEKIKEFIAIRNDLYEAGVIALDLYSDSVHVKKTLLVDVPDLQVEFLGDDVEYPFEVFTVCDGIKLFCVVTNEQMSELFPQLSGYMIEDVDLSGGEDHAIA